MSVLIRGMEMPKSCIECPLETDYGTCGYYSLYVEAGHDSDYKKRRDDCPLIEAEPCNDRSKPNNAPTVIEADYPPSTPLEQVWTELFGEDGEA